MRMHNHILFLLAWISSFFQKDIELDYTIEQELNLILKESESVYALLKTSNNAIKQSQNLLKNLPEQIKNVSDKFYSFNNPDKFIPIAQKFGRTLSVISQIANELSKPRTIINNLPIYSYYKNWLKKEDNTNLRLLSTGKYLYIYSHSKRNYVRKKSVPSMFENARMKIKSILEIFYLLLNKLDNEVWVRRINEERTIN